MKDDKDNSAYTAIPMIVKHNILEIKESLRNVENEIYDIGESLVCLEEKLRAIGFFDVHTKK
jgi:cob(I)alamin adenosyltransferase